METLENGDPYENIELTEDEKFIAINAAKKAKYYRIKNAEYAEKISEEKPALKLDAENMLKYVIQKAYYYHINFERNELNCDLVDNLCKYFTDSPDSKLDPNKGLLIFGSTGRGKTALMRLFNENQKSSFRIASCKNIVEKFKAAGNDADDILREFSRPFSTPLIGKEFKNDNDLGICFDDLGAENDVKVYGNSNNVMLDLILRCYDNPMMKGKVHITTNLTRPQIKEFYGERIVSRIHEMFNEIIIDPNTPDYRTLKK